MNSRAFRQQRQRLPEPSGPAFTMVEMLVVLIILTIVVALAVGLGTVPTDNSREEATRATMVLVMQAVQTYRDSAGSYPDDSDDCMGLMQALSSDEDARQLLRGLGTDVYAGDNSQLLDAYGQPMRYQESAGLGGVPRLCSKGKDGQWNTADDIRSDGT